MFLYNLDYINVGLDFSVYPVRNLLDCLNGDVGEMFLRYNYPLAVHRGHGHLTEGCIILLCNREREFIQNLNRLLGRFLVTIDDDSRMDVFVEEFLGTFQQLP